MDSDVYFIGGIWPERKELEIIKNSKGNVQIAANVLQKNLIKGIEECCGKPLTIINEVFVGAFPSNYKKWKIKNSFFSHVNDREHIDYNVGFLNFPLLKHLFRYWNSRKIIRLLCKNLKKDCNYFIGYSMTYSIVKGLLYAKKKNPTIKTCLIIPDLPIYMNMNSQRRGVFGFFKMYSNRRLDKLIKNIDTYVVLTKYMYERLETKHQPYVVVEGIGDDRYRESDIFYKHGEVKNIVYTGTLAKKYGVIDLVDAFHAICNSNLRLIICGTGDGESYIKEMIRKDSRIIYKGVVSNREACEIQRNAYLLVNPRNSNGEYTKYSFPSKTMEYMLSGRPVLMYRLEGIPEEYDDFLYYVDETLEKSLREIIEYNNKELDEKGRSARNFIIENKNAKVQAAKILGMISRI